MSLLQVLVILRARYKTVCLCLLGAAALVALVSQVLPRYTGETTVVVDLSVPDPVAGFVLAADSMSGYMPTQIAIVTSDHVAQKVVKSLGLDRDPALSYKWIVQTDGRGDKIAWLAHALQQHLSVTMGKESNLITIAYRAPDPEVAAAVANAFAAAYIETNIELRAQPAQDSAQWLHAQLVTSREALNQVQARISDYQRTHQLVGAGDRFDAETTRLNDLTQQLTVVQGQASEAQNKQRLAGGSQTLPEVAEAPVIAKLRGDISDAKAKLAETVADLGVNHPTYIEVKSHLDALQEQLAREQQVSMAGFGRSHSVGKAVQADLETAIAAQRARLLTISQQRGELNVLLQEQQSAEVTYQEVSRRYTQATLQSGSVQTNLSVLSPATVPADPSATPLLYALAAVFLGLAIGVPAAFYREISDRRIRFGPDIELAVGLPLLADFLAPRPRAWRKHGRRAFALLK
jgi:succinoglycan biosynthesis transport protein ExoP